MECVVGGQVEVGQRSFGDVELHTCGPHGEPEDEQCKGDDDGDGDQDLAKQAEEAAAAAATSASAVAVAGLHGWWD